MHYRLVHVSEAASNPANWERKVKRMFSALPQLTLYERKKLTNAVQRASLPTPGALGSSALRAWKRDLYENNVLLTRTVAFKVREHLGSESPPFTIRVHQLDEDEEVVRVETDLALPEPAKHKVVWLGMAAIGNMNFRIEQMRSFEAVCGFREEERPLVDAKLSFLLDALHDKTQEEQLARVLEIANLPDLGEAASRGELDLEKLLVVRESKECAEFREWLRSLDRVDDVELRSRVDSLRARIGGKLASVGGRAFRFLASAVDPTAGILSGAAGFFADKVFARPGPIVFLNDQLPSVFTAER